MNIVPGLRSQVIIPLTLAFMLLIATFVAVISPSAETAYRPRGLVPLQRRAKPLHGSDGQRCCHDGGRAGRDHAGHKAPEGIEEAGPQGPAGSDAGAVRASQRTPPDYALLLYKPGAEHPFTCPSAQSLRGQDRPDHDADGGEKRESGLRHRVGAHGHVHAEGRIPLV